MINFDCANVYCNESLINIENYYKAIADTTQTWVCHHRLELTADGKFAHSREELIRLDMYYDRPAAELIFLTKSEHVKLHNNNRSYATRRKISEAAKKRHAAHRLLNHV